MGFPLWWAKLCHHLKLSNCLYKSLMFNSMSGSFIPNLCLKILVLEGEFLLSFGHWGFADLGGGSWIFPIAHVQNMHKLALPVLNTRCWVFSVSCKHEVGKIGHCRSALGSQLRRRRQILLSKPPSGADVYQFSAIVIFSQEFRVCQHRWSLWYRKICLIFVLLRSNSVTAFWHNIHGSSLGLFLLFWGLFLQQLK